jgi:hypothetical protein
MCGPTPQVVFNLPPRIPRFLVPPTAAALGACVGRQPPRRPVHASEIPWALRRCPLTLSPSSSSCPFPLISFSRPATRGGGAQAVGRRPPELHIARDRATRRRLILHRAHVVEHRAARWVSTTVGGLGVGKEEQLQASELRLARRPPQRLLCCGQALPRALAASHAGRCERASPRTSSASRTGLRGQAPRAQAAGSELRRLLLARDGKRRKNIWGGRLKKQGVWAPCVKDCCGEK